MTPSLPLWTRAARAIGYLAFLAVVVFAAMEFICRRGWFPNDAASLRAQARMAGNHRVLFIGDSFSIELGPRAITMAHDVRAWLEARGDAFVNLAVSGYGPPDYLDRLELFAADVPGYSPDIVIVNYFVGNDLTDTIFNTLRGGLPRAGLLRYRNGRMLQRSFFLRALLTGWQRWQISRGAERIRRTQMQSVLPRILGEVPVVAAGADVPPGRRRALNPYLVGWAIGWPTHAKDNILVESEEAQVGWSNLERILRAIHGYTQAHRAQMMINIFPSTLQVNDSHYQFFQDVGFAMDRRMLTSTAPQDRLQSFCKTEHVLCNDLLPLFKSDSKTEHYLEDDDHWSTPGHQLAASGVQAALESSGWLGAR